MEHMKSVCLHQEYCVVLWSYFKKDNKAKNNPDKDKIDQREKGLL